MENKCPCCPCKSPCASKPPKSCCYAPPPPRAITPQMAYSLQKQSYEYCISQNNGSQQEHQCGGAPKKANECPATPCPKPHFSCARSGQVCFQPPPNPPMTPQLAYCLKKHSYDYCISQMPQPMQRCAHPRYYPKMACTQQGVPCGPSEPASRCPPVRFASQPNCPTNPPTRYVCPPAPKCCAKQNYCCPPPKCMSQTKFYC